MRPAEYLLERTIHTYTAIEQSKATNELRGLQQIGRLWEVTFLGLTGLSGLSGCLLKEVDIVAPIPHNIERAAEVGLEVLLRAPYFGVAVVSLALAYEGNKVRQAATSRLKQIESDSHET